ncbi:MAG: rhodanese-like domain-containing protein, partial [Acidimicrobiales bacterium]
MPSFRELLAQTRARIREVEPAAVAEMAADPTVVVIDVREGDEYAQGALPGAVHIPRGFLESKVEARFPRRDLPIVVYCAGGTRSAFAAETLAQLGYRDVVSMAGGFGRWKNEGRAWET